MSSRQSDLLILDAFGLQPSLFINNCSIYRTLLGVTMTLIVLTLSLVAFFFIGAEIFQRKIPTVNFSKEYDPNPKRLLIDKVGFDFFLKIEDPNGKGFIDPTIYTLNAYIGFSNSTRYPLSMDPCSDSSFTKENADLLRPYNFNDSFCLSNEQLNHDMSKIFLQGSYGQDLFQMIVFKIFPCQNTTTSNITCKSPDQITRYLYKTYVSLYIIDNNLQTSNYNNPTQKGVLEKYFLITQDYYVASSIFINHINFQNDIGWISQSNETTTSFGVGDMQNNIGPKKKELTTLSIQLSSQIQITMRKYMKLSDLFAQVGGIVKFLMIACQILYIPYNNHFYFEELFNVFFSFSNSEISNFSSNDNNIQINKIVNNLNGTNDQSTRKLDIEIDKVIELPLPLEQAILPLEKKEVISIKKNMSIKMKRQSIIVKKNGKFRIKKISITVNLR